MVRILAVLLIGAAPIAAASEVTVSITITGPVDELMPLLELLRQLGHGTAAESGGAEGVNVRVHSVTEREGQGGVEEEAPAQGSLSLEPAFADAAVDPERVTPGNKALITLRVSDPENKVDTVVATLAGAEQFTFDLYDNGTRGDAVADDGIWSYSLPVPDSAVPSKHFLAFKGFDRLGEPVNVTNAEGEEIPLSARASFEVVSP